MERPENGAAPCAERDGPAGGQLCKVTAIIRLTKLEAVEARLRDFHVPGISVTKVKGYGEYANFFRPDWMVEHARIEIFLHRERADEVARAITAAARTGESGDGIVAVLPVEVIYRVRTGDLASCDDIGGCESKTERKRDDTPPATRGR